MSDRVVEVVKPRKVCDRPRQTILNFGASRTKEAPAEATDVNKIIARYHRTGSLPVTRMRAAYGDVSALADFDYGDAVANVQKLNEAFAQLPANVRDRFKNDAGAFLAFVQNADNKAEAVKLGLIVETPVEVKNEQ